MNPETLAIGGFAALGAVLLIAVLIHFRVRGDEPYLIAILVGATGILWVSIGATKDFGWDGHEGWAAPSRCANMSAARPCSFRPSRSTSWLRRRAHR